MTTIEEEVQFLKNMRKVDRRTSIDIFYLLKEHLSKQATEELDLINRTRNNFLDELAEKETNPEIRQRYLS